MTEAEYTEKADAFRERWGCIAGSVYYAGCVACIDGPAVRIREPTPDDTALGCTPASYRSRKGCFAVSVQVPPMRPADCVHVRRPSHLLEHQRLARFGHVRPQEAPR